MVVQMAKAIGARVATAAGSNEKLELCRRLGADLALNYKTDDIPSRLREFSPEGIDVWYETQREPNLEVSIPLLRKHGRMILMAGRTAKPVLPLGAFYPRNCAFFGFAMFNATPDQQRRCADAIIRWIEEGQLKPLVGRTFPLTAAADAQRFLEDNTLKGAGSFRESGDHGRVKSSSPESLVLPRGPSRFAVHRQSSASHASSSEPSGDAIYQGNLLLTTLAGSMMEGFLPQGWDLGRIDACCAHPPGTIGERQTVVASRLRAGTVRFGGRLRRDDGP